VVLELKIVKRTDFDAPASVSAGHKYGAIEVIHCCAQYFYPLCFFNFIFHIRLVIPKAIKPKVPKKDIFASKSRKSNNISIVSIKRGTKLQILCSIILFLFLAKSRTKPLRNPRIIIGIVNMTKYKPMVLISPFSIAIIEIRKLENRRIVPIKIAVDVFIYFILCTTYLCMISLRFSATKLANTNRIENPRGFS